MSGIVCNVMNEADMCGRGVHYVMSQSFFCSSLVKSEQTRLRPAELKFESNKYSDAQILTKLPQETCQWIFKKSVYLFICLLIYLFIVRFLCFQANLCLRFRSPIDTSQLVPSFPVRFTIVRRSSCGPIACWILERTSSLVTWSLYV